MSSVFKVEDTVYHPVYGKGEVTNLSTSPQEYRVAYESKVEYWSNPEYLSFTPWPKPCHERPFNPTLKAGDTIVYGSEWTKLMVRGTVQREHRAYIELVSGITVDKRSYLIHKLGIPFKSN